MTSTAHRVPRYTPSALTTWYNSESPVHAARVLRHFRDRTAMTLDILEEAETTTKTAYVLDRHMGDLMTDY
jgi:DNA polymerase zeta